MRHSMLLALAVWLVGVAAARCQQIADVQQLQTASGWRSLWDGKTLDGWRTIGGGEWRIADGELRGTHVTADPEHGHLITREPRANFALRLKFLARQGNSGAYFRVVEGGDAGVLGFQAEIDPANDVGGLYETGGRGWVVKPQPDDVSKWLKPQDWNELIVAARGQHVVVFVNGHKSADIQDERIRAGGYIALQLHGGQDVDVRFKDVAILELGGTP